MASHQPLAVADGAVGIDRQKFPGEVVTCPPESAQRQLELGAVQDTPRIEQCMDGSIGRDEGQAIGEFEALLGKCTTSAHGRQTHGGLVDQVKGQTGLDTLPGLSGPPAEQIPGVQTEQFGHQQPDADLIA